MKKPMTVERYADGLIQAVIASGVAHPVDRDWDEVYALAHDYAREALDGATVGYSVENFYQRVARLRIAARKSTPTP